MVYRIYVEKKKELANEARALLNDCRGLLGVKGLRADLEILTTAISALSAVAEDFRIELGHAEVFDALSDGLVTDATAL